MFSLETTAVKHVEKAVADIKKNAGTEAQEHKTRWQMEEGIRLGAYNLELTWKLYLVFLLNALAIVGSLFDFWLERRGPQPLPRMDLHW